MSTCPECAGSGCCHYLGSQEIERCRICAGYGTIDTAAMVAPAPTLSPLEAAWAAFDSGNALATAKMAEAQEAFFQSRVLLGAAKAIGPRPAKVPT